MNDENEGPPDFVIPLRREDLINMTRDETFTSEGLETYVLSVDPLQSQDSSTVACIIEYPVGGPESDPSDSSHGMGRWQEHDKFNQD